MDRRTYLAVGASLFAGCSSNGGEPTQSPDATSQTNTSNQENTSNQTEEDTTSQSADVAVGEVVGDNALQMVVRDISRMESINQFQQAEEGNEFVVIRLAVKNITEDSDVNVSGMFQTRIKDSENYTYQPAIAGADQTFQAGTLSPGEVARGDLYYEVPADTPVLTMQFDFSGLSLFDYDRVTIDLSSEADTISDLTQNIRVETYSTGEGTEFDGLEVIVNSVEYRNSIGSFAEASSGYEFVIVDISTTNNTNEEISISTLLQMECKDERGFSYSGSLTAMSQLNRAYPQGSPLGPGETRRGKIPYEVPADAEMLYWMFEFSVFVDGFKTFWQLK